MNPRTRRTRPARWLAWAAISPMLAFAQASLAQPHAPPPLNPPPNPPADPTIDPDAPLAERLEQRLASIEDDRRLLLEAIEDLEAGVPEAHVRERLASAARERFAGGRANEDRAPALAERLRDRIADRRADRRGPPEERGGQFGAGPPTDEEIAEAISFLKEHNPDVAERLERATSNQGEGLGRRVREAVFRRAIERVRDMRDLQESDPEMFERRSEELKGEAEVARAARALHEALRHGEGVEQAEASAREAVRRVLEIKQDIRAIELARFERRLDAMRASMNEFDLEAEIDRLYERLRNRERLDLDRGIPGGSEQRPARGPDRESNRGANRGEGRGQGRGQGPGQSPR